MKRLLITILKNLHIFKHHERFYAFNPNNVKLITLSKNEAEILNFIVDKTKTSKISKISKFKSYQIDNILNNLKKKRLLKTRIYKTEKKFQFSQQIIFMINSSSICNLKCKYCYAKGGEFQYKNKPPQKISTYHIKYLMEILPEAFPKAIVYNIHFYGGEPLLNLDAIKTALDCAENKPDYKYTFTITTNGTLVNDKALSLLKRGKFEIIISIDGPSEIHDRVRATQNNKPSHQLVLQSLKRLKEETNLSIRVSSVIFHNWTLKQARDYQNLLDVDYYKAQPVRLVSSHPLSLNIEENHKYLKDLTRIADEIISLISNDITPRDDRFNNRIFQILRGEKRENFCGAGINSFGLATDGTVLPCALLAGQNNSILGYIDDPQINWIKKGAQWARKTKKKKSCKKCWALSLCGGGCPAMINVSGDLECHRTKKACELALAIYGAFYENNMEQLLNLYL